MQDNYVMPTAKLGFALWYESPDHTSEPIPCLVTAVSHRAVSLTLWAEDNRAGQPRDGVRHISDPEVKKMAGYTGGVWDFSHDTKAVLALTTEVASLRHAVASIVDAIGGEPATGG